MTIILPVWIAGFSGFGFYAGSKSTVNSSNAGRYMAKVVPTSSSDSREI